MRSNPVALLLWVLLGIGVLLIVAMTWHPWVQPWTGTGM